MEIMENDVWDFLPNGLASLRKNSRDTWDEEPTYIFIKQSIVQKLNFFHNQYYSNDKTKNNQVGILQDFNYH